MYAPPRVTDTALNRTGSLLRLTAGRALIQWQDGSVSLITVDRCTPGRYTLTA
jgi:hypothetical protein